MRGITYVQAFQYWMKTFAIALPACLLLIHLGGLPERAAMFGRELPQAPAAGLDGHARRAAAGHLPGGDGLRRRRRARARRRGRGGHAAGRHGRAAAGRRRAGGRRHRRADRRGVGAAGHRVRRFVAGVRLLAAAGHVPRHDGPAAHPRSLLHEPGRPGGAAYDGARARPAGIVLRVPGRLRRARPRAGAGAVPDRPDRLGRAAAAGGGVAGPAGRDPRSTGRGGRVRRLHVDGVRPDGVGSGHDLVRPLAARAGARGGAAQAVPAGRAARRARAGRARARRPRARHLGARRLGVRARGEHVLPAAPARNLVGGADRARSGRPGSWPAP